jgi:acetyl esterase/lipase
LTIDVVRHNFYFIPVTMRVGINFTFCLMAILTLFSCNKMYENSDPFTNIKPNGAKPAWAPTITPQMQRVIEKLDSLNLPPMHTLTPQMARQQPSIGDAALAVMQEYGISYSPMYMYTDTAGRWIPAGGSQVYVRIYKPRVGKTPFPVIVYYHGGNWVTGNIDAYHTTARALSEQTECIVASVAYRPAPEHPFPAAHNDARTAYKWITENASAIGGNPARIAVAGEGAGANLAIAVSMFSRDSGISMPRHQVLIYPIAYNDTTSVSFHQYATAKPVSKPLLQWALSLYNAKQPWLPMTNASLQGLPASTIIAAEIDPLQSEGERLASQLQSSGVATTYRLFSGVTHDFFGIARVLPEAKDAQKLVADQLKNALK